MQNNFEMEPYPRLVEVIVEPKTGVLPLPRVYDQLRGRVCLRPVLEPAQVDARRSTLHRPQPIDESPSFATLLDVHKYLHSSGLLSICWRDDLSTGSCHPANISSSELSSGGPVRAWVPLELSANDFEATLRALFPAANPPARRSEWPFG